MQCTAVQYGVVQCSAGQCSKQQYSGVWDCLMSGDLLQFTPGKSKQKTVRRSVRYKLCRELYNNYYSVRVRFI